MITTGIFPEFFKTSKIVYKRRVVIGLISLLPTMSKSFECIIHDQMYTYLNSSYLLAEPQFSFCKIQSTEYAAGNFIDHVAKQIESGQTPCNLYIDISKSFGALQNQLHVF